MDLYEEAYRATVVLVAASVALVAAGLAGFGASVGLAGGFSVLAGALSMLRDRLRESPTVAGHDLAAYGEVLWLGPLVAAAACLLFFGSTAEELQTLGGLVGLVGMLNYFLRPVYRAGYAVARVVARAVS